VLGDRDGLPLLADGERVVDVPPKPSARTRVFATGQGRKTDVGDAHSVALAATRMTGLRVVVDDQQLAVLRILADRRRSLGIVDHVILLEIQPRSAQNGHMCVCSVYRELAQLQPFQSAATSRPARSLAAIRPWSFVFQVGT
jgi:transposase